MSTDINDIYYGNYIEDLFRDLNGILKDENRSDFPEVISAILALHIQIESLIERFILDQMMSKFEVNNIEKLEKLINMLCFKSKIAFLESLGIVNDYFFQYCKELNRLRNVLAHGKAISNAKFFKVNIFSIEGFETLRIETEKALELIKDI